MKSKLLPLIIVCALLLSSEGLWSQNNVTVTDDESYTPHNSAMLDVKSTDKGVLIPRLTSAQRLAIPTPATGLLVFDSDIGSFFFYNGTAWQDLSTSATYTAGTGIDISGTTISNTLPDQSVTLNYGGATTVSGTYPNFTITSTDNVDDADADPANELQTLTLAGADLSISNGNTVTLPAGTSYSAGTGINITGSTISNTLPDQTVTLNDGGATTVSGAYPNFTITSTDNVDDADADPNNEVQDLNLSGNQLTITGNTAPTTIDLSSYLDNTDDQTLTLAGADLSISNGNTVTLPAGTSYSAGTGIDISGTTISNTLPDQTVTLNDGGATTVSGTYPNFTITSTDNVDDADADPANEIQDLQLTGDQLTITSNPSPTAIDLSSYKDNTDAQTLLVNGYDLSISNGNTVSIPTLWTENAGDVYRSTGYVGVGTTMPSGVLHVEKNTTDPLIYSYFTGASLGSKAIKAEGAYDTYGYSAIMGTTGFDGITTANWNGMEIGMAGVSVGGSATDNYGVIGHSNGWGGMFEHSTSSKEVYLGGLSYAMKITDGNQGSGKVLTSDASGNAYWSDPVSHWTENGDDIYRYTGNVGVGKTNPTSKLEVKADPTANPDDAIFQVINTSGDTVFAVYPSGVRVYIDDQAKAGNNLGGFAVSGRSANKGINDYLTITPDSTRIYVNEIAKAGNNLGGFAVSGRSATKGTTAFTYLHPDNYFIGHEAGLNTTPQLGDKGKYNSFIGFQAGMNNTEGYQNIFIGHSSGKNNLTGFWNTFLGYEAGLSNTGSDNTFIGYRAGSSHLNQGGNVYLGSKAGENATNGEQNVYIGESAGSKTTYGKKNVFIGFSAGYNTTGSSVIPDRGSFNVFLGNESGYSNTIGKHNVFLGNSSGYKNTSGYGNVFIGFEAGYNNQTGNQNLFLGYQAGKANTTGSENLYIGFGAGQVNSVGDGNTFIGYGSGAYSTAGNNTFVGAFTGYSCTSGYMNTFLGRHAGYQVSTGWQNTLLGFRAGYSLQGGTGNVFIGCQAGYNETGSRKLYIDNTATSNPIIYGELNTSPTPRFLKFNAMTHVNCDATGAWEQYGLWVDGGNSTLYSMYVYKGAVTNGSWSSKSDKRFKSNIETLNGVTEKLRQVRGVRFDFKTEEFPEMKFSDQKQIGVIAQELEEVFPEIVFTETDGYKSVAYDKLSAVLLQAIKEQQEQIDELKRKIEMLENK